jgi:putative ABC transport system permease protein
MGDHTTDLHGGGRSRSRWGVSLRSWWSWALEPWRSAGVTVALVGSLALPALLLSAGPMFEAAASDEVARRVVEGLAPGPAGVTLSARGRAAAPVLDPFSEALEDRLASIDPLAVPVRLLITDPVPGEAVGADDVGTARVTGRLFARRGAVEALEVVAGSTSAPGVWITETLASDLQLGPGSTIAIGGLSAPVTVAGVYRDLWSTEPNDYWSEVPSQYVPRFLRVFNSPEFELIVVDDALMGGLGPSVRAVWEAPLDRAPQSWEALVALTDAYRQLERDLAGETEIGDLHRAFAVDPDAPPSLFSALFDARSDASAVIAELERPIATATVAGAAAGLALSTLGAVFLVRRRRSEYRLLAADGDGWWRFFVRAGVQYTAPALAGMVAGVAIAWLVIVALGPSGSADLDHVPWLSVAALSLAACLLAGAVTASLAIRTADGMNVEAGGVSTSWLLVLGGAAVAMWLQVGELAPGDGVGPLVVAFPFVGIVTGVVMVVLVFRLVLRAFRRTGARLPTSLFLGWRALTGAETGALLVATALGLAAGLAVLSAVFVASVDTAIADKAVTVVGSDTRLDIADRADPATLPADTTIFRTLSTQVSGTTTRVIAVDPDTFSSAVLWPSSFGRSPAEVIDALGAPVERGMAAVVVGDRLPDRGEFGVQRVFPYEVVARLESFPLASVTGPTLVVRTDRLEAFARQRFEQGLEVSPTEQVAAEAEGEEAEEVGFASPLDPYTHTIVSRASVRELAGAAEAAELVVREVVTLAEESNRIGNQATRWAFDFLRILAAIGAMTALVAMALYLSERRRERVVAAVMVDQMGIPMRTNIAASVVEMVGLASVALAAGTMSALLVAWRAFPSFEPDPATPPGAGLLVTPVEVLVIVGLAVAAIALTAAAAQFAATSTARGSVFRG